jgi:hypothetical protein
METSGRKWWQPVESPHHAEHELGPALRRALMWFIGPSQATFVIGLRRVESGENNARQLLDGRRLRKNCGETFVLRH